MRKSFKGKTVWIVGASSGIGEALAHRLHAEGARLVLTARSQEKLHQLKKHLGDRHHVFPCDVSDLTYVKKVTKAVQAALPQLDSVLFMAALYQPMTLAKLDMTFTKALIDVNIGGALNLISCVLPVFHRQKFGQIALCGSVAAYCGLPNGQPYSASKAAVANLAESLRIEEAKRGIDVKLISPGFVRTPLTEKNNFKMPMRVEPDVAAERLVKGLKSRRFEIHFPRRFTYSMKLLRALPYGAYFQLFGVR